MWEQKIRINHLELGSRIVMPPMVTAVSTETGKANPAHLKWYDAYASNPNISMIIVESSFIDPCGRTSLKQLSIAEEEDLDGLGLLAECIRSRGKAAVIQINHGGSAARTADTGIAPLAPSSVTLPGRKMADLPEEMTEEQIRDIVRKFAAAAERAKRAGFDGVEIHSAHGFLLNQFYSPLTNWREDAYGGTLEKRLRIHREVIRAVRQAVGPDFFVSVRFGGCDYLPVGSTIEESVYAAKAFEEEGADLISVTGGMCMYMRAGHTEPGYFRDMSEAIRGEVKIPILLTGGVKTLREADTLLQEGAADLIGVGRALLGHPEWETQQI